MYNGQQCAVMVAQKKEEAIKLKFEPLKIWCYRQYFILIANCVVLLQKADNMMTKKNRFA